ncbi:unnamed protein product [Oppiella nova]|uniref:Uncharacterized protein n=1 Tax=Oppiella nova TaxID=334625 RepID=A0A7R9M218_9ACAR|nr:unnamed protein product [Oppiella nova]CAG2169176.1 unnamed protein product [Oppiella nova]
MCLRNQNLEPIVLEESYLRIDRTGRSDAPLACTDGTALSICRAASKSIKSLHILTSVWMREWYKSGRKADTCARDVLFRRNADVKSSQTDRKSSCCDH